MGLLTAYRLDLTVVENIFKYNSSKDILNLDRDTVSSISRPTIVPKSPDTKYYTMRLFGFICAALIAGVAMSSPVASSGEGLINERQQKVKFFSIC